MRVLVIGGGGREHAIAWKLARSPLAPTLYCAPGNAGIAELARCVALDTGDDAAVVEFARGEAVDLVVIGPEAPLVRGLADALRGGGIRAFGPGAAAARLEGSKAFVKALAQKHGIPTARFRHFTDQRQAAHHAAKAELPLVIKADGLAAGKGVAIATTREEAAAAVERLWGPGGLVIEEHLNGEEASLFYLVSGTTILPFGTAQDHKRAHDGDTGPNTGGMGAISPMDALTPAIEADVLERIVRPTVMALARAGSPYQGFLYAGVMLTAEGPKLLEYNVRLGDPEAQALLPRLTSDLLPLMLAAAAGESELPAPEWSDAVALTVVMAAQGYPDAPAFGGTIEGLEEAEASGAVILHAGTGLDPEGQLVSTGGRVLGVTALGDTPAIAQANAYSAVDRIGFETGFCRRDIGWRAVAREAARARETAA